MRLRMTKAYITVEATVIIPLLIASFVLLTYMCIYVYDRTLLYQDALTMAVYAKEEYFLDDEEYTKKMDSRFAVIKEERPYLSLRNLNMSLSKKGNSIIIDASGDFYTPFGQLFNLFYGSKDKRIYMEACVNLDDPVKNMLTTKDLVEK